MFLLISSIQSSQKFLLTINVLLPSVWISDEKFPPVSSCDSCDSVFGYQVNIFHVFIIFNGCLLYMLVNQCTALLQPHSQNQVLLPEGGGGVNFGLT